MKLFNDDGAEFSPCKKYRYALWRIWDKDKPMVMFIGLNPSTANEHEDDPTIRRVKRFAADWGYGGVYMLNCFPYVSTNPDDLRDFGNTETNDKWLKSTAELVKEIIFAWGSFDVVKDLGRDKELIRMFPNAKALIINSNGSPRHPLYVKADTKPVVFKRYCEKSKSIYQQPNITDCSECGTPLFIDISGMCPSCAEEFCNN